MMSHVNERVLAYDLATVIDPDDPSLEASGGNGGGFPVIPTLQPTTFNGMSYDLNLDH